MAARCAIEPAAALRVGGLTPFSASDYPGRLAAVVFCQGCPWRCGYCHNPHLLPPRGHDEWHWNDVVSFLERRRGLLDAVVFSGGEPLAQRSLAAAMRAVRRLGFRVGLHTGGAYPRRLAQVLPWLDWVGFDVKSEFGDYARITRRRSSGERARASATLLLESGTDCEFRTTVHAAQLGSEALARLATHLAGIGVRHYALQEFRATGCADAALRADRSSTYLSPAWCATIAPMFESLVLRRA